MKCIYYGQEFFENSRPLDFFKSRIERKFWTVVTGIGANIMFIIAKPSYIALYEGNSAGWIEPYFLAGHVLIGFCTAVWHHMSYEIIKGMYNERNC